MRGQIWKPIDRQPANMRSSDARSILFHGPILLKRRLACISVREMQRGEVDDLPLGRQGHWITFVSFQRFAIDADADCGHDGFSLASHP